MYKTDSKIACHTGTAYLYNEWTRESEECGQPPQIKIDSYSMNSFVQHNKKDQVYWKEAPRRPISLAKKTQSPRWDHCSLPLQLGTALYMVAPAWSCSIVVRTLRRGTPEDKVNTQLSPTDRTGELRVQHLLVSCGPVSLEVGLYYTACPGKAGLWLVHNGPRSLPLDLKRMAGLLLKPRVYCSGDYDLWLFTTYQIWKVLCQGMCKS